MNSWMRIVHKLMDAAEDIVRWLIHLSEDLIRWVLSVLR